MLHDSMEIRQGKCAHHGNIPSYGFAALPRRNEVDVVGMLSIKSCQAGWLFGKGMPA